MKFFFYWSSSNWASYRKLRWSQKYQRYVSNLYESLLAHTTRTWNTMVAYAFPFKVNTKWRTRWHTTHCVTAFDVIRMNWNRFEYDWHFDGSYYELSFCKMMDFWWASIINTFYWQDIPLQWRKRKKIKRNQEIFWNWHCEFSIKKGYFMKLCFFQLSILGFLLFFSFHSWGKLVYCGKNAMLLFDTIRSKQTHIIEPLECNRHCSLFRRSKSTKILLTQVCYGCLHGNLVKFKTPVNCASIFHWKSIRKQCFL